LRIGKEEAAQEIAKEVASLIINHAQETILRMEPQKLNIHG